MISRRNQRGQWLCAIGTTVFLVATGYADAHPHVFVDANVEIVRNEKGEVVELRHKWQFDELFSSTVALDYDANGDKKLDAGELQEVAKTVSKSIAEYNYYTEVRSAGKPVDFIPPKEIAVDYVDNQIWMFITLKLAHPVSAARGDFKFSVADDSFYVAIEFTTEAAIQIKGGGGPCRVNIERPDFDKLLKQSAQTLTEQFFNNPKAASLGDEWYTWITLRCK